jgi:uncharacterized protein
VSGEPIYVSGNPAIKGHLHVAKSGQGDSLVLTHGAGGNANARFPLLLAEAFAGAGLNVLRCDLPFRQKRPYGPPSPASAKEDQQGLKAAAELMRKRFGGRVFLGGQSYGGRQATMLAAAEPHVASGLLLLSYPLHPPNKPTQMRTAHFPKLECRTLFVSGTKDPFGTIEELNAARGLVPAATTLISVPGAGHSLLTKKNEAELVANIVEAFTQFFEG